MPFDLTRQFLKLLVHFRQHDLVSFSDEHRRLYAEAEQTGEYGQCIAHYYSVMSKLIDEYFGGSFHFVPPLPLPPMPFEVEKTKKNFPLLSRGKPKTTSLRRGTGTRGTPDVGALRRLHTRIGECLQLGPGKSCLDIGCGIGDVIEHLAFTGANLIGLTIAPNEVQMGNANFHALGIHTHCKLIEADCTKALPLEASSQDAAYAIYALKYLPKLGPVFRELARVIKPNGLLAIYDLLKTDKFDKQNAEHRDLLESLEFACGMPSLHSRQEMLHEAALAGFELVNAVDLDAEAEKPFHYCFSHSRTFMWMMRSPLVAQLIKLGQLVRILPPGFHRFNKIFLSGTIDKIVRAGDLGILSGAQILLFQRTLMTSVENAQP